MKSPSLVGLACLLGLGPAAFGQASPEARKDGAAKGLVITDDNLRDYVKNSRLSVIGPSANAGAPAAGQAPAPVDSGVPSTDPARAAEDPSRAPTVRFVLRMAGACGGFQFIIPSWCPDAGEGVSGGLYKEIRAHVGDLVELDLENDPLWTPGQASFILTEAEPIEACSQDPVPFDQVENCRSFPSFGVGQTVAPGRSATVRFKADKAGVFKYYDGFNRSGYGRLIVEP